MPTILLIGEFLLLVTVSLLVFALWASERKVAEMLTEQFVSPAGGPAVDPEISSAESSPQD